MTWFQAQQACRASGKRLPNGEEWLAAATGTNDPGAHDDSGGFCVTNGTKARTTGGGTACQSRWGAQDMIGSVWEWTSEWYAGLGDQTTPVGTWPATASGNDYKGDGTWNIASSARDGVSGWTKGLPAAALRGGGWSDLARAGLFSLSLLNAPSSWSSNIGFRCISP